MPKKSPSEWSPAYRKRIEAKLAKNPDISLAEARGHKPKPPAQDAPDTAKLKYALREKQGNIRLREKMGYIDKAQADAANAILKEMEKQAKGMEKEIKKGTIEGPSSLEWTLFSQQQKEKELEFKQLTTPRTKTKTEKGKKIVQQMQKITEKMWTKAPAGTQEYYDYQDRLAKLYKRLENLGFVARTGDIVNGDVGYH